MRVLIPRLLVILAVAAAIPAASEAMRASGDPRDVLRQVAQAQADHRASRGRYTASLRALGIPRTPGVDVRLSAEGAAGWSAVAIGEDEECAVFHGGARPPRSYVRAAGRVVCRAR